MIELMGTQNQQHVGQTTSQVEKIYLQNRQKGILFSFGSLMLLSTMPIITNGRPDDLDALTFTLYLSIWQLLSSLPLLIYEIKSPNRGIFDPGVDKTLKKKTYVVIFGTGIIFLLSTFLYILAFEKAGTIPAAIAMQTYPLFAMFLEALWLRSSKTWAEITCTILLVFGIYYLGTEGSLIIDNFSLWFGMALFVPLLWSVAHITIRQTISNSPISPNQITFFRVVISSSILLIICIITGRIERVIDGFLTPRYQLFGFLMGVIYYLELVSWFNAIKNVKVSVASTITTASPVVTLMLAVMFLYEEVFSYHLISLGIVFSSLYGLIYLGRGSTN